jgi:hypothetical protein
MMRIANAQRGAHIRPMGSSTPEPKSNGRKRTRPAKLVIDGIEIQRPTIPPVTPLWKIERAVKIAVQQYADKLAAEK